LLVRLVSEDMKRGTCHDLMYGGTCSVIIFLAMNLFLHYSNVMVGFLQS